MNKNNEINDSSDTAYLLSAFFGILLGLAVSFASLSLKWWLIGTLLLVWLPFWPFFWLILTFNVVSFGIIALATKAVGKDG